MKIHFENLMFFSMSFWLAVFCCVSLVFCVAKDLPKLVEGLKKLPPGSIFWVKFSWMTRWQGFRGKEHEGSATLGASWLAIVCRSVY